MVLRGMHCKIYICVYDISYLDSPTLSLSLISSPFLRTISMGLIIIFSYMNTKYIHHIHPHLSFPYALPLPLLPTPGKDLFYPLAFFFFLSIY
jgi:hypothetical protein